jgi:hypothetical protein
MAKSLGIRDGVLQSRPLSEAMMAGFSCRHRVSARGRELEIACANSWADGLCGGDQVHGGAEHRRGAVSADVDPSVTVSFGTTGTRSAGEPGVVALLREREGRRTGCVVTDHYANDAQGRRFSGRPPQVMRGACPPCRVPGKRPARP